MIEVNTTSYWSHWPMKIRQILPKWYYPNFIFEYKKKLLYIYLYIIKIRYYWFKFLLALDVLYLSSIYPWQKALLVGLVCIFQQKLRMLVKMGGVELGLWVFKGWGQRPLLNYHLFSSVLLFNYPPGLIEFALAEILDISVWKRDDFWVTCYSFELQVNQLRGIHFSPYTHIDLFL